MRRILPPALVIISLPSQCLVKVAAPLSAVGGGRTSRAMVLDSPTVTGLGP